MHHSAHLSMLTKARLRLFGQASCRAINGLITLLLCFSLLLGGCAGQNSSSPKAPQGGLASAPAEDDPFKEDDAYDYLTKDASAGQTVVGEDYFDDDYLEDYSAQVIIPDPLEPWNRFWFKFNDIFIEYAARPISKGYTFITPAPARRGLKNFFYNLRAPVRVINCLLQGKGQEAGVEFSRFFLNTIAGFGGFMDVAKQYKTVVPATGEDFGQTLGRWGLGEGVYLVWPFLGPSNVRETFGSAGNYLMGYYTNPIKQFGDFDWTLELGISAVEVINGLDDTLKAYDTIKGMAVDPYTAMRDGYTQLRRSAIAK